MSGPAPALPGIVAIFRNDADGIESRVFRRAALPGYSVVLVDTDADEALTTVLLYPILRDAIEKALALSGILLLP